MSPTSNWRPAVQPTWGSRAGSASSGGPGRRLTPVSASSGVVRFRPRWRRSTMARRRSSSVTRLR
eukprot:1338045-Alexandrium_andersonii.AAC.1